MKYVFLILVIVIVGIGIFLLYPINEKYCEIDSDCVKVCKECCCHCVGYDDAVNRKTESKIDMVNKIRCIFDPCRSMRVSCALSFTEDVPICVNNLCEIKEEPRCNFVCGNKNQEMIEEISKLVGMSKEELLKNCNCTD